MGDRDHLLGIGGVGMSALAQALIDAGRTVTGADRLVDCGGTTPVLEALRRQGMGLFPETGAGIDSETSRVIASTAIEESNPVLLRARALDVPVVHRAAALAEALSGRLQFQRASSSSGVSPRSFLRCTLAPPSIRCCRQSC